MARDYCELYVDSDESRQELQALVSAHVRECFPENIQAEGAVFRNDAFYARARQTVPYDFIESSEHYVELALNKPIGDQIDAFQEGTIRLIKALRSPDRIVSASCEFEDAIAAATGWNWTKENPNPPR